MGILTDVAKYALNRLNINPNSSQTNDLFRIFVDEISVITLQEIFFDAFSLDPPLIRFHDMMFTIFVTIRV